MASYTSHPSFKAEDLKVQSARQRQDPFQPEEYLPAKNCSDHMFEVKWMADRGWSKPKIFPFTEIIVHPASCILHLACQIFDEIRAFRGPDNVIRLFRADVCMSRLTMGVKRAGLPDFEGRELLACIKKLVSFDTRWVPAYNEGSLYIRITIIGTEPTLYHARPNEAIMYVTTSPVRSAVAITEPLSLFANPSMTRCWKGGCGSQKMACTYTSSFAQLQDPVKKADCNQILWLCGKERYICQVGYMNFFLYWTNDNGRLELLTPPLSRDVILPGITRQSVMEIVRKWGSSELKMAEKPISMPRLEKAIEEGRVREIFGVGVAGVVSPVSQIVYIDKVLQLPPVDQESSVIKRIFGELRNAENGLQCPDWTIPIEGQEPVDDEDFSEFTTKSELTEKKQRLPRKSLDKQRLTQSLTTHEVMYNSEEEVKKSEVTDAPELTSEVQTDEIIHNMDELYRQPDPTALRGESMDVPAESTETIERVQSEKSVSIERGMSEKDVRVEKVSSEKEVRIEKVTSEKDVRIEKVSSEKDVRIEKVSSEKEVRIEKVSSDKDLSEKMQMAMESNEFQKSPDLPEDDAQPDFMTQDKMQSALLAQDSGPSAAITQESMSAEDPSMAHSSSKSEYFEKNMLSTVKEESTIKESKSGGVSQKHEEHHIETSGSESIIRKVQETSNGTTLERLGDFPSQIESNGPKLERPPRDSSSGEVNAIAAPTLGSDATSDLSSFKTYPVT